MRRPLIVGNWKMNGDGTALPTIEAIAAIARANPTVDVALCLPATLIQRAARAAPMLPIGGQDCHVAVSGAHTGGISAAMLREAGASCVILGHSERRSEGEIEADIARKVSTAHRAGLVVILCVGEQQRRDDAAAEITEQLRRSLPDPLSGDLIVAYEPVWAIGSGDAPDADDVLEITTALRRSVAGTPILYGGSVTAGTAPRIIAGGGVDGLLVGKASLTIENFGAVISAVGDMAARAH